MYRSHFGILLTALIALAASNCLLAESRGITAVLSNSEAVVGQTVQLQIHVTGFRGAETPEKIDVDGLQIYRTGTEQHFEVINGAASASVIYDYTILPGKPGTFKIPPQTVRAGGNSYSTPELTLHVVGSATRQAGPNQGSASKINLGKLAFAELIVPKKTAYVGEIIPVVIRVGFFARGQPVDLPEITGQGFTVQKFQVPDQAQSETIDGRHCDVLTFKTAIAAVRSGKLDIGPVKANAIVRVLRERPQRNARSPFDIFNMDDPFSDPSFADPFGAFGRQEKITITSDPVALDVKPLPSNPPPSFAGAIGSFSMAVDAKPKSVQVGDPITVTATISGRGNFDRVTAPTMEDEHGWHKYPPSSKFKQDDDVGISGGKKFETVLSPNESKQALSPFLFSFFDPQKEQYVTLKSDAIPIHVEGGTAPAVNLTPAAAAANPATPSTKSQKQQDILYQLTDWPSRIQIFTPLYARPNLWLVQLIPMLAFLGFVGWKTRQRRMQNLETRRIAALNHESADLLRKLRREDVPPHEYYLNASRAIQVKTALAKNIEPNAVDVETAGATFQLDENSREQLRQLFARSDELRYSGAGNGGRTISPENRRQVLDLIEHLRV